MTENLETLRQENQPEGNTSSSGLKDTRNKQGTQRKRWIFTLNNYTKEDIEDISKYFRENREHFIFGEEIGKNGTPHLQGYVELNKAKRWTEFGLTNRIHWNKEPVKGTRDDNIKYCSKEGKIHTNFKIKKQKKPILDLIKEENFYPWQKELYNILKGTPDKRKILWYWDKKGNVGKSAFCKFICCNMNAIMLGGGSKDMMKGIHGYEEKEGDYPDIIIGDYPRDNIDKFNYGAWEMIKNGHVYNSKYESGQMIFNIPHIVIFCNEEPCKNSWSKDRYHIKEIKNDDLIYSIKLNFE